MFASQPHFLNADPKLYNMTGLSPDPKKHDFISELNFSPLIIPKSTKKISF